MSLRRCLKNLLISALTVGVVCSCCSCAIKKEADTTPTIEETISTIKSEPKFDKFGYTKEVERVFLMKDSDEPDYDVLKEYNRFLHDTFSSTILTRATFLQMILDKMDIEVESFDDEMYEHIEDRNYYDSTDAYVTAIENGLMYRRGTHFSNDSPATKQFISTAFVRAMEFEPYYTLYCNDYFDVDNKVESATVVHLGYFELDDNSCFNPNSLLDDETVEYLLSEIDTLRILKGKTILSFGDSIMYGDGNNGVGIAELMSQRYQTTTIDYSKGGSTFGIASGREQISDQILRSLKNNDTADIILLNGGTNDMRKVKFGTISDDFHYEEHGRKYFCNGMEYALGLIKENFEDVPLVYIRAHDMTFSLERNELHYGKTALDICEKWEVTVADVFSDSDLNTHKEDMKYDYTFHSKMHPYGDSVHPNRMGYYKYYVPLTVEKIKGFFEE